jgi:prepilin-type N-terminal cleavage/methylation domain-containing protein
MKDTPKREGGFSLVELAVVIVVIGALLAAGIPTFLGMRARAANASAQAKARQGLLTQKAYYTNASRWGTAAEIQGDESSVTFEDLGGGGPQVLGRVYVKVDGDTAVLASRSSTGKCYWIREPANAPTSFATVDCNVDPTDADFAAHW